MTTSNPETTDNLDGLTTQKVAHRNLVIDGVYSHCAHCGMKLTDARSIESGLGPICRKKGGYYADPVGGDQLQAFIVLSDYPELIKFLSSKYKEGDLRGLMNGLVGCCALNRRSPVHKACCEAIEALGFKQLASTLRKSLASVSVKRSTKYVGSFEVNVVSRDYRAAWFIHMERTAFGVFYDRETKSMIVPIHKPDNAEEVAVNGDNVPNKLILWEAMVRFYQGLIVKTPNGNFEIKPGKPELSI